MIGRMFGVGAYDLIEGGYEAFVEGDYEFDKENFKDYKDTLIKKALGEWQKYDNKGVPEKAQNSSPGTVYGYYMQQIDNVTKFVTDTGIEDAKAEKYNDTRCRYTGSYGICTIERENSSVITVNGTVHPDKVSPEYINSFDFTGNEENSGKYIGLAEQGGWSQDFTDEVVKNIDKNADPSVKDLCKELVEGGYSIENILDTEKNAKVKKTFDTVQVAFNEAYNASTDDVRPEVGMSDQDTAVMDIWDKQARGGVRLSDR